MKSKDIILDFNLWYFENRGQHAVAWEKKKASIFLGLELDIEDLITARNAKSYLAHKAIHEEIHTKFKLVCNAINERFGFKILKPNDFVEYMSNKTGLLSMSPRNYIEMFKEKK